MIIPYPNYYDQTQYPGFSGIVIGYHGIGGIRAPLTITLSSDVEYDISLSPSLEYGINLSGDTEYNIAISTSGNG